MIQESFSIERMKDTKKSEFQIVMPKHFIQVIFTWKELVSTDLIHVEMQLQEIINKPSGVFFNPKIFLDQQGRIWGHLLDDRGSSNYFFKLIRSSLIPHSPYKEIERHFIKNFRKSKNGGTVVSFTDGTEDITISKKSLYHIDEDWGWQQNITPDKLRIPKYVQEMYEFRYRICIRGIRLADILLSQKEEIIEWIHEFGKKQGPLWREKGWPVSDDDTSEFIKAFAPTMIDDHIPDSKQLWNVLSCAIDQAATGKQLRRYNITDNPYDRWLFNRKK